MAVSEARMAVLEKRVEELEKDQSETLKELKSLRGALITFALSISGSAVVFAFTMLQVLSK